jgi:hypothetical protein
MTDPGNTGAGIPDAASPDLVAPADADGAAPGPDSPQSGAREPRPLIERVGLAIIALVVMAVFGAIAAASFASGELFLALMGAIGVLMTAWAAGLTLVRG